MNPSPNAIRKTQINLIYGGEITRQHNIDLPEEIHGILEDEFPSKVSILIGSNGEFYATIKTLQEIYLFEPLSYFPQYAASRKVLAYRLGDVVLPNMSVSHDVFPQVPHSVAVNSNETSKRQKRSLNTKKKFCGLHFIADYMFFLNVGDSDFAKTVDIIVKAFSRVNEIFMSTDFIDADNANFTQSGFGFYIKGISIETSPTPEPKEVNNAKALLTKFSRRNFSSACLHHFLTFTRNPFGVLGMSWMAGPSSYHIGGICSPSNYVETREADGTSVFMAPNIGFTTYCDSEGSQVLSSVAELVTAHELGHSWGAPHDPDTAECTPSAEAGGRYLMYTYAVPGYSPNNYRFSPCSRRSIGRCLASRAALCFEERPFDGLPLSRCGNSRIDPGEQCDPGFRRSGEDLCCTSTCQLKPGAQCSPRNHQCCTPTCQLAEKGTLCAEPDPEVSPCLSAGRCDGQSPVCPGPLPISEVGRRCYEHGHCLNGVCTPFCSRLGLKTCICDKAEDSCLICCAFDIEMANGDRRMMCQPIAALSSFSLANETTPLSNGSWNLFQLPFSTDILNTSLEKYYFVTRENAHLAKDYETDLKKVVNFSELVTMHLENNRPCAVGICRNGLCVESKTQNVGRLWPLFLSTDGWTTLLWNNIVAVIVTLTLIVWIPLSCIVRLLDKKLREAQLKAVPVNLRTTSFNPHGAEHRDNHAPLLADHQNN
ncbi:unnamed protein product [Rodentolepis nana]|uniref:Peptidase M12B domain-containing protein n=1 Tax=Rodentolepis nana TaxID=102285 RepID=A0A3P7S7Y9_RODNA|nr:unnamed protein product [Rodentolepis nana]